ncbi:MAG TPA: YciI family protein [Candidatus Limnocylindrales bacterium]|nr:YciI family protein [Candidatus Limnocylindrales bacterium]
MLYAILIYDAESANPSSEPPPPDVAQAVMTEYNAYTKSLRDSGAFQAGDALQPATTATTIRQQDGRNVTTDGPFAETKEALGGFYIVEARDLDEALRLGAECPGLKYGSSIEVRPVLDYAAVGQATAAAGATA